MPSTQKPGNHSKTKQYPENDIFRVVLYAPDRESLAQLLRKRLLDVGPVHAASGTKEIEVHLFVNEEQILQLRKDEWRLEVHENLSEVGRNRQKEVGKGDRFEGGNIAPKGLGTKPHKEG